MARRGRRRKVGNRAASKRLVERRAASGPSYPGEREQHGVVMREAVER